MTLSEVLEKALTERFGQWLDTERLGGKSGAAVYRLRFTHGSAILKASTNPAEYHFYAQSAPSLRRQGIGIPALLGCTHAENNFWLALEDIAQPLPRQLDLRLITMLARLHRLPTSLLDLPQAHFAPDWTPTLTKQAVDCFEPHLQPSVRHQLERWQQDDSRLFEPECFISGDPNPANWGVRSDGTLVLFDWERFCRAAPAIDLAIIIPGLGTREQYQEVATAYLRERESSDHPYQADVDRLAEDITRAKVWTVVGYLSQYTEGPLERDSVFNFLTTQVPGWLKHISP
jgi:hypothetical protein